MIVLRSEQLARLCVSVGVALIASGGFLSPCIAADGEHKLPAVRKFWTSLGLRRSGQNLPAVISPDSGGRHVETIAGVSPVPRQEIITRAVHPLVRQLAKTRELGIVALSMHDSAHRPEVVNESREARLGFFDRHRLRIKLDTLTQLLGARNVTASVTAPESIRIRTLGDSILDRFIPLMGSAASAGTVVPEHRLIHVSYDDAAGMKHMLRYAAPINNAQYPQAGTWPIYLVDYQTNDADGFRSAESWRRMRPTEVGGVPELVWEQSEFSSKRTVKRGDESYPFARAKFAPTDYKNGVASFHLTGHLDELRYQIAEIKPHSVHPQFRIFVQSLAEARQQYEWPRTSFDEHEFFTEMPWDGWNDVARRLTHIRRAMPEAFSSQHGNICAIAEAFIGYAEASLHNFADDTRTARQTLQRALASSIQQP